MENFENNLRKKLEGHQLPADLESIWQGVQANKEKKKRRFAFWWIFPVLVLTGIGVYLVGQSFFSSAQADVNLKVNASAANNNNILNNPKTKLASMADKPIISSQENKPQQTDSKASLAPSEEQNLQNKTAKASAPSNKKNYNSALKNKISGTQNSKAPGIAQNRNSMFNEIPNDKGEMEANKFKASTTVTLKENGLTNTEILNQIPLLSLSLPENELLPNFLYVEDIKKSNQKQFRSSIYALTGAHLVSAQTDPNNLLYCAKPQYGFNVEIGYQKQIRKSPFSYQIGLGMSHILYHCEKIDHVTKTIEALDSTIILRQLNGEEKFIGNIIYANQTTTTIRNNYQRSYIFNGIVGLAYTKTYGKWSYGMNTGLGINIQTKSTGYYYWIENVERIKFTNFMKTNVGFSGNLGLNIGYDLTKRFALISQLNSNYYFMPLSVSGDAYKYVFLTGMQVGLKYRW